MTARVLALSALSPWVPPWINDDLMVLLHLAAVCAGCLGQSHGMCAMQSPASDLMIAGELLSNKRVSVVGKTIMH